MRHFINLVTPLVVLREDFDNPQDKAILLDMFSRADRAGLLQWAAENDYSKEELSDEEGLLWVFQQWLHEEYTISIDRGMVEFYRLDYMDDTRELIGDNPILLYHFTSSARLRSIRKEGLLPNKRSMNRRQTEGVFLTTESSGPAITGYIRNALQGSRGAAYGVRLDIRTFLHDIEPDPDDADIQSGSTQFVTEYVAPKQIISVERA